MTRSEPGRPGALGSGTEPRARDRAGPGRSALPLA